MNYFEIKYIHIPQCPLCGKEGNFLYRNLTDRLYGCEGEWNFRRCPDCGLLWLDPRFSPECMGKAYQNYYTHTNPGLATPKKYPSSFRRIYQLAKQAYLAENFGYGIARREWYTCLPWLFKLLPRRRELLKKSIMWLPWRPKGKLLDVGCGNGKFLSRMQELGWQVEGVEVDPKAVLQARAQGLTVRLGELDAQGYPDNFFDAITLNHVIEHVSEPVELLRECHRLLSMGGLLVVVTPNPNSLGHKIFGKDWRGLEPPRHLFLFSRAVMTEIFQRAGFRDYEMRTIGAWAPDMFLASRGLSRKGQNDKDRGFTWADNLLAKAFGLLEQWQLRADPEAGEELVVIARKVA